LSLPDLGRELPQPTGSADSQWLESLDSEINL
jgi:hypothetical protein